MNENLKQPWDEKDEELKEKVASIDGYLNELDERVKVLEKEFNKMNEVQQLLKYLKKELGLDDEWKFEKVRSAVRTGDKDLDEGEN